MAPRRFTFTRRRDRRAEIPDLGLVPPIEADGAEHSALERRRVSLRWLMGTVLTGFAGFALIGAAIYAAFDRESRFAEAPVAAGPQRRETSTDGFVNPGKGDRLVKRVDIAAGKQSFKTPTTVQVGEREVVRVKGFTRVATNLVVTSVRYSEDVPAFNPQRLMSDARNPAEGAPNSAPDPILIRDEAEISFITKDIAGLALPEAGPSLSPDEIQAQVTEHFRNSQVVAGQRPLSLPPQLLLMRTSRATLDPAGGLGYGAGRNQMMAPFSSIEVRMVPENVTEVPRAPPATQAQSEQLILIRRNESLEDALRNSGVNRTQIPRIVAALGANARGLTEGQKITVTFDDLDGTGQAGQVAKLTVYVDDRPGATIAANDSGTYVTVDRVEESSKTAKKSATDEDEEEDEDTGGMRLYNSLYETALKQEMPKNLIGDLVRVFANDVDFQRPVAAGDSFEAFYEDSEESERTDLLYASITTRNETFRYYRFVTPDDNALDYYDENGRSTRKFLIRKPIANGEQRSTFGMRRHPILHYMRMHTGVDWSAPMGTPIFAAGNGTIIMAGRESGYGNRIEIQHPNGYVTTYNHMSGFARGMSEGARVRQGQVIGFLGMTGLATGPHLHYEVIVNGHFVDPLRVRLARTRELDNRMLASFKRERDRIDGLIAKAPNAQRVASRTGSGIQR